MVKHPRKKQKTTTLRETNPLGTETTRAERGKDDEELLLESLVFDGAFSSTSKLLEAAGLGDAGSLLVDDEKGRDMEHMLDSELFFVDDAAPTESDRATRVDDLLGNFQPLQVAEDEREGSEATHIPTASGSKPARRSAWADPDDSTLQISLGDTKRARKLRDDASEDVVSGSRYESKLRREFERIQPAPEWANKAKSKAKAKRRRSANLDEEEEVDESGPVGEITSLLSTVNGVVEEKENRAPLEKGALSIERLRDANLSAKAEGQIKALQFHPSPRVPLLFTASSDRRLRLYNIDGHTNPHIQTVHIPELPVTSACFHPTGSSILLTGERPQCYTFDLQTGQTSSSPRGLWGSFARTQNATIDTTDMTMEVCAFNPDGNILAVGGRRGFVHLVDWSHGNGTQVIGSVKMNAPVKALCWTRSSGGRDGTSSQLLSLSEDADIYQWDVGERRCLDRWKDDGGFGSCAMSCDRNDRYLGVGSRSGIVNVYKQQGNQRPRLLKAIDNLTTAVSAIRFNHDSQLMAITSKSKVDHMRLVHMSSLSVFSNWPTSGTPLGHVTAIDFSASSDYIAIGNNKGRVLLYHLLHYHRS